ncbi:TonB-dependent receptor [Flavobacteriaceae bacterium]|nr:TonB-dependent receptor [Flavobacteriaceae bacterium]
MKHFLTNIIFLIPLALISQTNISGIVLEQSSTNAEIVLPGANVYWMNTTEGVITNLDGEFTISNSGNYSNLIISYVGFKSDTIDIKNQNFIKHYLKPESTLDAVNIKAISKTSSVSYLTSQNIINVSSEELLKAACCNLSESFETNPSIDVNFTDAITGVKQIQMLGLTSPYILITTENIPTIRGASQVYGLSLIPGTWVESIQITKGVGSVINGYESISGQINAELQKPNSDFPLFFNSYLNTMGKFELNTHYNTEISNKLSTGLYFHLNSNDQSNDHNSDGFLDSPLANQINFLNRWQYTDLEKGLVGFFNFRYLEDEKQSGEIDFDPSLDRLTTNNWGSEVNTERFDTSIKFGYVNPDITYQTLGFQLAYSDHSQNSYFGLNQYDISHQSIFSNIIYNSIISDTRHKIKTGLNFNSDTYKENVVNAHFNTSSVFSPNDFTTEYINNDRSENSIGAFFEYNFDNLNNLNLTAGIRADRHNKMGTFLTPRFHLRYTPVEKSVIRFSFGRGKRMANIFAENQNLFATTRQIILPTDDLKSEDAWNYGVSFLQNFNLFNSKAELVFDYYYTNFTNQVVVDWENPYEISFYNLEGKSYASSFQSQFNYYISENIDLKLAYKLYDVKTDYSSGILRKPMTPKERIFLNFSLNSDLSENKSQWKFDTTFNWIGEQRYPNRIPENTTSIIPIYQAPTPDFTTVNSQLTRVFSEKFEFYIGAENLTNTKQKNPIFMSEDPFSQGFDTTFVYGPIFGSMYYAGLRFKIY